MLYYTFTTVSTVGFGDLHPKSNAERIWMAFGMMLGVALMGCVIGNILDMIAVYDEFHSDYGDPANL